MSEELLINVSPMESRVAVLNNSVVSEIYIERHNKLGLVGNIYLGTVVRVLPGMQAAFVDIGQSRTAFLHVNDMRRAPRAVSTSNPAPTVSSSRSKLKSPKPPTVLTSMLVDGPDQVAQAQKQPLTDDNKDSNNSNNSNNSNTNNTVKNAVITALRNFPAIAASRYVSPAQTLAKLAVNGVTMPIPMVTQVAQSRDNLRAKKSVLATESDNLSPEFLGAEFLDSDLVEGEFLTAATSTTLSSDGLEADLERLEGLDSASPEVVGNAITQVDPVNKHQDKPKNAVPVQELIQHRLQEGQKLLVQVTKDQLGTKGARLTTNISLPSRYLVYLPSSEHIGISQRIDSEEERYRLKTELATLMANANLTGGLIARTAAERVPAAKLEEDIYYLVQLWRIIQARKIASSVSSQSAVLIYQELSLSLRALRDLVHVGTEKVMVDNEVVYNELRQFSKEFVPSIYERIGLYTGEQPLFDVHRVEEDLKDALKRRVDLKSGGYLIIDQTEAMTTIDVNTGSFVGGRSLEDTVYKTNLEATQAIAHHLRLRNLGGIIILDFIDMLEQQHKDDVLDNLQHQLSQDYAKTKITQVSELGLVEMTRKRTRESLEQQLCEPCQICQGRGFIKTAETVCFEIFREIMRCARTYNAPKKFTVVAHAAVIDLLLSSEADTVADLEYLVGRVITFEVESLYTQEQYDIVLD